MTQCEKSANGAGCAVFDIDGTLAQFDTTQVGHYVLGKDKQWDEFHAVMADAGVIEPVARVLRALKENGSRIVMCSGRPAGWAEYTKAWLEKNDLPFDALYLRPEGEDERPDPDVKRDLLRQMRQDGHEPWIVVDDRSSVVDAWRDEGLICLQCAPGDF